VTREEAIRIIETVFQDQYVYKYYDSITHQALNIAIEALSADAVEVVRCEDCKHFELDHFDMVNGIPIITAHEICTRWCDGAKTDKNGFCFMAERRDP
jgi:hypothetical protein